jgi:hypothetical protein
MQNTAERQQFITRAFAAFNFANELFFGVGEEESEKMRKVASADRVLFQLFAEQMEEQPL